MHYYGPTYRPPYEAQSLILQVTSGCSHNACAFCSMYRGVPYTESPLHEVESDLYEAARYQVDVRRIFLANGDAFGLSAERLLEVAELVRKYLPNVESIGGYASIKNIMPKTDDELTALARVGYAGLNIGIESGLDDVLKHLNKGYTLADSREQMRRLNEAGLVFNVNIINAAAGPHRIAEHAAANAALVNEADPQLIFVSPLHIDPGTPLAAELAAGGFEECTLGQYVEEELAFLRGLELSECVFFGLHVSNPVKAIGLLPRDKEKLIAKIEAGLAQIPPELRDSHPAKGAEGRILD